MKNFFWSFFLVIFTFFIGFPPFSDSQDFNEATESINMTLMGYEKAWNKKDADGVISFYQENAQIMTGGDKRIVTKREYRKIIPDRFNFGKVKFGEPDITIKDNNAKVKVKASYKRTDVIFVFYMVSKNNEWLILSQEY